jgi:hypothetical protein
LVVQLKARFLEEFRRRGNIADTARVVGIARRTPYIWRKSDKAFAASFEDAAEEAMDLLDGEARRRAMGEVQTPVYYQGEVVGLVPRYSDALLMFLLRAHRPGKYRERYEHRVPVADPRPVLPLAEIRAFLDGPERS